MTGETGDDSHSLSLGVTMRRLLSYMTKYRFRLTASVFLMIGFSVSMGLLPALMGKATDIISTNDSIAELRLVFLWFVLDAVILWICGHFAQRLLSDISQEALFNLRTELFNHLQSLSLGFFDRQPIGELMSRVSNDTDVIDQFFSNVFQQVLQSVTTIIVLTIVMIVINPLLTVLIYLAIFGMLAVSITIARVSGPAFERMQEELGELNGFAEERLAGQFGAAHHHLLQRHVVFGCKTSLVDTKSRRALNAIRPPSARRSNNFCRRTQRPHGTGWPGSPMSTYWSSTSNCASCFRAYACGARSRHAPCP